MVGSNVSAPHPLRIHRGNDTLGRKKLAGFGWRFLHCEWIPPISLDYVGEHTGIAFNSALRHVGIFGIEFDQDCVPL